MQLYIAGGCGDQGRNCFYIEGDRHAFIVDAGTSTDGLDRLPDLSPEMIRRAEYLFVTHSHKDHTGAIEYLENNGFTGPVLMSNQTYQQIHYKPKNTMILDSTAPELSLDGELSLRWGRTGHCAGAVWYYITVDGKRLFFSGDYRENDTFYRCDAVRGLTADLAVIDSAYSRMDRAKDMRKASQTQRKRHWVSRLRSSCLSPPTAAAFLWRCSFIRPLARHIPFTCPQSFVTSGCASGIGAILPTKRSWAIPSIFSGRGMRHLWKAGTSIS